MKIRDTTPPRYIIYISSIQLDDQRLLFQGGHWSSEMMPGEKMKPFTDDKNNERTMDGVKLPSSEWQWVGKWAVALSLLTPDNTDKEEGSDEGVQDENGWTYARSFAQLQREEGHGVKKWSDMARRRKWARRCVRVAAKPGTAEAEKERVRQATKITELQHRNSELSAQLDDYEKQLSESQKLIDLLS